MGYWGYPRYVSVSEKRAKAEKKLKQLLKKNPDLRPVILQGSAIAKTWWGKSWNENLERYADYGNRIGRGRSYVRNQAVLDLQIAPGKVEALVQGSASSPYEVTIGIKPIPPETWKAILRACDGKMASLQALLSGEFPKDLQEIFMTKGKGLFPAPAEIKLSCNCPDWAVMCKHVAAVLYGIGARLDEDPNLFFTLRKADVTELISKAVADQTDSLLKKAKKKSARVMDSADLSDVFGIDLTDPAEERRNDGAMPKTPPVKPLENPSPGKRPARKAKTAMDPSPPGSAVVRVEALIRKSRKGMGIPELVEKTGFDAKKIYNILFRLKKMGKIRNLSWGIFIGTP